MGSPTPEDLLYKTEYTEEANKSSRLSRKVYSTWGRAWRAQSLLKHQPHMSLLQPTATGISTDSGMGTFRMESEDGGKELGHPDSPAS